VPVRGVTHMAAKFASGENWPCTQAEPEPLVNGGLPKPVPPPEPELRLPLSPPHEQSSAVAEINETIRHERRNTVIGNILVKGGSRIVHAVSRKQRR
jgi:hypothetical protein